MKRTLVIVPYQYHTNLRAKGLSIKSAGNAGHELCLDETGYYIRNGYNIDPKTALISVEYLIKYLIQLRKFFTFDKIKIKTHYSVSGDFLMEHINKRSL